MKKPACASSNQSGFELKSILLRLVCIFCSRVRSAALAEMRTRKFVWFILSNPVGGHVEEFGFCPGSGWTPLFSRRRHIQSALVNSFSFAAARAGAAALADRGGATFHPAFFLHHHSSYAFSVSRPMSGVDVNGMPSLTRICAP